VTLIGWCIEPFTLEDVSQMSTTRSARYFCPDSAERIIHMAAHSAGYRIKEGWPSTSALELGGALVQRSPTASATVRALFIVLIIDAGAGLFRSLLAEDAELLRGKNGPPFLFGFVGGSHCCSYRRGYTL